MSHSSRSDDESDEPPSAFMAGEATRLKAKRRTDIVIRITLRHDSPTEFGTLELTRGT